MEYLKLAIVDSENYSDYETIADMGFDRVIVYSDYEQLAANYDKTHIFKNFEIETTIYGNGNKDNMDGYICAKVGEYTERYRDFRTYLTITIFSNDRIFKGISNYYTRKGYNISTAAPKGCITGTSNTKPEIRILNFLRCSDIIKQNDFKKHFKESSKDAFYRLIVRRLDKDIPKDITDKFINDGIISFSSKTRKINFNNK